MKSRFLGLLSILILLLNSCRKDNSPKEYMRFKANDIMHECTKQKVSYNRNASNQITKVTITGYFGDSIKLEIYPNNGQLDLRTYYIGIIYVNRAMVSETICTLGGLVCDHNIYRAGRYAGNLNIGTAGHINITQIEGDYIKGNFSFTAIDDWTNRSIKVSEGAFSVHK